MVSEVLCPLLLQTIARSASDVAISTFVEQYAWGLPR
jgi:hypothetical protein